MMQRLLRWPGLLWAVSLLLVVALAGCTLSRSPSAKPMQTTSAPLVPTPSLPPTTVPGSIADADEVAETVRQFGAALTSGDEVVALLVLTPSAQQIVAASDLNEFLGRAGPPRSISVEDVQLTGDVATVLCAASYSDREQRLWLQLVRLDGVWKIDARVAD